MRKLALTTLTLSAALIGGSLLAAAPAEAATPCHDSASVQRAKHKERTLLAEERTKLADALVSVRDQQTVDRDQWNNDRADSGTTHEVLRLDAANLERDAAVIKALKTATTRTVQDRAYFARCGKSILTTGVTRWLKHSAQLAVSLDRGALTVETARLAYDKRGLSDALAVGDTTLQHQYQSSIDSDEALIRALRSQIGKLEKQIAKL
jgi:hypothetical protein